MEALTEAAEVAATPVVAGEPPPVSHPPRLETSAAVPCPGHRTHPRWDLQPLVLILLAMTWAAGDSQPEKFETARGFYVASYRARKRPGRTVQGFQKALSRLPLRRSGPWPPACVMRSAGITPSGCSSTASSRWAATARGSSARAPPSWRPGSVRPERTNRPPPSG